MRAAVAALAVFGYGALAAALGVSLANGDGSEVGWILVGPLPFCVVGLIAFLRRPENRVVWWLVGVGAAFGASTALGDVFLPMAIRHWGAGASVTALVALLVQWAGTGNEVAAIGMIGLFPSGRPERGYERVVIWTAAVVAVLLPLLDAVSAANIALAEVPGQALPVVHSGVSLTVLAPLRGAFSAAYRSYPFWTAAGVVLLALRYWQGKATERRQIRWLLIGVTGSFSLWVPLFLLWWEAGPLSADTNLIGNVLSALAIGTALVAMLAALFYTGVFGIDEPRRPAGIDRHRCRPRRGHCWPAYQPGRPGCRGRRGRCGDRRRRPGNPRAPRACRRPVGARLAAGRLCEPQPVRMEPDPGACL
jgi:hypothetical protein